LKTRHKTFNQKVTTKKQLNPKDEFVFLPLIKPNLRFKDDVIPTTGCLTVCVTRAGAGGGTPSDWGNAEA
jgi:hypothetical protein